jgi:RNA polymerase sigma factor for flagellar operon FliA
MADELPPDRDGRVLSLASMCRYIASDISRSYGGLVEYEDLLQDAYLGAMDAVDRYDESLGFALTTFAHRRIRGAVIDGIRGRDNLKRSYRQALKQAGVTVNVLSLDRSHDEEESMTLLGLIEDEAATLALSRLEDADAVRRAVDRLPARLHYVVTEYYWRGRTLLDIAQEMGVTESRVSQILSKAKEWLRTALHDTFSDFGETHREHRFAALA